MTLSSTRSALAIAIAVVAAFTLAACAADPPPTVDSAFEGLVADAIAEATAEGASSQQLDLLDDARAAGELTLEQVRVAVQASVQCMVDAGLGAEYFESTDAAGLPLPAYRVSTQLDITTAEELLIDECDRHHSFWVNMVYQLQPSASELQEALRNSLEDELRTCLEDAGYQTDPNANGVELAIQAGHVVYLTEFAVDCLAQTGAS